MIGGFEEKKWGTRFGRGLAYPASLVPVWVGSI